MKAKLNRAYAKWFVDLVSGEEHDHVELVHGGGFSGRAVAIVGGLVVDALVECIGNDPVELATSYGDLRRAVAKSTGDYIVVDSERYTIGGVEVTRRAKLPPMVPPVLAGASAYRTEIAAPGDRLELLVEDLESELAKFPAGTQGRAIVRLGWYEGGIGAQLHDPVSGTTSDWVKYYGAAIGGRGDTIEVPLRAIEILAAGWNKPVSIYGDGPHGAGVAESGITVVW